MKHAAVIVAAALALAGCDFTPASDPASLLLPGRAINTSPSLARVTGRRKQLYKRSAASYIPSEITNSTQGLSFTLQTTEGITGTFSISDTFHNFFFNSGTLAYNVIVTFPGIGFGSAVVMNISNRNGNLQTLGSFSSVSESIVVSADGQFACGTLAVPASGAYESLDSEYVADTVAVPFSTTIQTTGENITLSYSPALQRTVDITYTPLNKYIYTQMTAVYAPDTKINGVVVHDIVQSHAVNGNEIAFTLKAYTESDLYTGYVASIILTAENGELSTEYLTIE
jgi:hypothetical protein